MPRFETLDGASVAILDNQLASRQSRYGFLSLSPVKATSFLEVRFNTLGIGSRDIDGLIEISVKSASDPSKFVLGRLHGGCFNGCKSIELQHSSLTGWQASSAIWEANTWYRLRLLLGARPEVQLWNDSKTKMLASVVSPTSTVGLGDTLYIGFSQRMDAPDKSHNLVVAVDSIEAQ
jgi:hypothetical protein